MLLNGKRVNLTQLTSELTAAGVPNRGLTSVGDNLYTLTSGGSFLDLPPAAQAVLDAHVPPPIPATPDFGADLPPDYEQQLANGVGQLRQYLGLASPTLAQSTTAIKLLIRVAFFILRLNRLG